MRRFLNYRSLRPILYPGSNPLLLCIITTLTFTITSLTGNDEIPGLTMNESQQPKVDLEYFRKRIPPPTEVHGSRINSISDVLQTDFARKNLRTAEWSPVPTDIFILALGKPKQPYWTKIGGNPYRSKWKPWPERSDRKLSFLCQWDFVDSKDIISTRGRGDVLQLYLDIKQPGRYLCPDKSDFELHWSTIGDGSEEAVNQGPIRFTEMFGCRLRYQEYPGVDVPEIKMGQSYLIPTTQATRIGGVTWYIQGNAEPEANEHLLCTMNSLQVSSRVKFPFINHPEPIPKEDASKLDLMFADVGCVYVFINDKGKLRVDWDSY
jgi:hypothetical protein